MAARSVWWLRSAWSAWACRVGLNSMVVWLMRPGCGGGFVFPKG